VLIVAGQFQLDPADRDRFLKEREDTMRRSRSEPGCITYVFSADPLEPGMVHLFERWESKSALADHLAANKAHPQPPTVPVVASEIRQYEIAGIGALGS
jgi:quinol monooxygenase YgiN